jgi:hypothetical protein
VNGFWRTNAFAGVSPHVLRMSLVVCLLVSLLVQIGANAALAASDFTTLADFPVPSGHFYSQASGQGVSSGFSVVDDGSASLYSEFQRLGSVDALGYPSSQRFAFGGFTTQSTQKELLQWRPDTGRVDFVNIFDVFSDRGLDPVLAQTRLIPPTGSNAADSGMAWSAIVARHLAILDASPPIRARFLADSDPINNFGLPQAIKDYGNVVVVRCERAAFQLWRVATPFAKPGDVTQVNAGDLAKELGIIPAPAATPISTVSQIVAPPGDLIHPDPSVLTAARQVGGSALASLARIDVTLDGGVGLASGIVIDRNGDILTNQHVIDSAQTIKVTFSNGSSQMARVVGSDVSYDLAVIQVNPGSVGAGVKPAVMLGGGKLNAGQFVVALGFSPYFPTPPATRLGVFQSVLDNGIGVLRTDTFILPGDSGGMLLDLSGNVVGINDEIRITRQVSQPLIGFSIDAAEAMVIGQRLLAGGTAQ